MKKILLGMGALISFLFLLGSCSSAASSGSSNDDDNKSKDTANEKAELYKSAIGEYTNYSMDKTFSIAETFFMFEGISYAITPKTDLYYENELPAEKSFTGKYTLVTGYNNPVSPLHLNKIVGKEDNDTLSLEKWMEHYYFEEEDLEAYNTYAYEAEQKNEEWYQLLSAGFYDYNNDVYYKKYYELRKYHTPSGYSKILYLCPKTSSYIFGLCYNSDGKLSTLYRFEANRIGLDCRIKKIKDYKKDRLKKTDSAFSWYGLEDENGNHYTIIDPVVNYSELDKLVEEFFAEEIEESGLSVYQWKSAHSIEWNAKKDEIEEYYSNKEEELFKEETYEGIIETAYSVYPKNSGSSDSGNDSDDDDDDDDDNGSGSGGSIDASDFEGITWKYAHENVSSTTTQNVVFKNGTVTVTTITKSNNSSTTNKNREETASYELDGDKITITYSKYGYDTTAEFTISVDGNTLTLESDDDDYDAISLLGTLFQNSDGTSKMSFTLSDEGSASDSDDDEDDSNSTIKASDIENITWKYQYEYNNWYFEFKNGKVTQRHVIQGSYMGGLEGTYKLKGDKLTVTYQSRYDGSDITGTVRLSFTDYGLKLDAEGDTNAGYVVNGFFEGSGGKQYLNRY